MSEIWYEARGGFTPWIRPVEIETYNHATVWLKGKKEWHQGISRFYVNGGYFPTWEEAVENLIGREQNNIKFAELELEQAKKRLESALKLKEKK